MYGKPEVKGWPSIVLANDCQYQKTAASATWAPSAGDLSFQIELPNPFILRTSGWNAHNIWEWYLNGYFGAITMNYRLQLLHWAIFLGYLHHSYRIVPTINSSMDIQLFISVYIISTSITSYSSNTPEITWDQCLICIGHFSDSNTLETT